MQKCTASWLVLDACTFLFKFHRSNIYHGLNLAEGAPPIEHSFLVTWKYLQALWQTNQLKNSNDAIKFDKSWQYHKSCQYRTRRGFPNEVNTEHWSPTRFLGEKKEEDLSSLNSDAKNIPVEWNVQQIKTLIIMWMKGHQNRDFWWTKEQASCEESQFGEDTWRERSQEIVFLKWFPGISDFFLLVAGFSEPSNITRE